MGLYIRKSLGTIGPVRFNLSKSGIGMSAGVRGARIGIGPRGAYLAGGRGGLYHRQFLNTGSTRSSSTVPVTNLKPSRSEASEEQGERSMAPRPSGYGLPPITLGLIAALVLPQAWPVGLVLLAGALWLGGRRGRKNRWSAAHDALLLKLTARPDEGLLSQISASLVSSPFTPSEWQARHQQIYRGVFADSVADGLDEEERRWLASVAATLDIQDEKAIRTEVLRVLLWRLMMDGCVTVEEERFAERVIGEAGLSREDLSDEIAVMDEFIRARQIRESGLPVIEAGMNLQRGEVCHHATRGAFLDRKILRSYTRNGQKYKEEGLVVQKEGDIYITSKRILIVADGTSGIPHQKIMDIEINQDEKLIEIVKDGRQKPVYIRAPDAVYSGAVIEVLSNAAG